jgi:hypothetical protein
MADEIPDTPDKAVQIFIGLIALGFACGAGDVILHGEILLGGLGFLVAAFFSWVAYKWLWLRSTIGDQLRDSVVAVATNAKWWMVLILLIFACLYVPPFLRGSVLLQNFSSVMKSPSTGRISWNFDQTGGKFLSRYW